eukprot:803652-Pelagomonas_calceolata.AAC.4
MCSNAATQIDYKAEPLAQPPSAAAARPAAAPRAPACMLYHFKHALPPCATASRPAAILQASVCTVWTIKRASLDTALTVHFQLQIATP